MTNINELRMLADDLRMLADDLHSARGVNAYSVTMSLAADQLEAAEKDRDNHKHAYNEWIEKTEWVQLGINDGSIHQKYLGQHRADIVNSLLKAVERERDALRAEIANIKEVEFPRKAQAVSDGWRSKCQRLEAELERATSLPTASEAARNVVLEKEIDALRAELSKQQSLTDTAQKLAEIAQRRADRARAEIDAMKQQKPVAWRWKYRFSASDETGSYEYHSHDFAVLAHMPRGEPIYLAPGAQGEKK